jgi:hypothetical protein
MKRKPEDPRIEAAKAIDPDAWEALYLNFDDVNDTPARRKRARQLAKAALAAADKVEAVRQAALDDE